MQITYNTNSQPQTLKITVQVTKRPEDICIRIIDAKNPKAVYENRHKKVFGTESFFVKLPITPQTAIIQVYNVKRGVDPKGTDGSFKWTMKPLELTRKILPIYINSRKAREFVEFAQEFSKVASVISAGFGRTPNSIYRSSDGSLRIDYYDVLFDPRKMIYNHGLKKYVPNPRYGQPTTTSMRTNAETGVIEVSKRYTQGYTIPMLMMVLLHEYSHFYVNTRPEDEEEADRNAAVIFLCMGYSKIAAHAAFIEVFKNADTPMNRERERKLFEFIEKFNIDNYMMVA